MQTTPAAPQLPAAIAGYFAHETSDAHAVARCFTEEAIVVDERQQHRGREAILAWNTSVRQKFSFSTELLSFEAAGAETIVRGRVSGTFPGSPVELRFRFTLQGDLIARLEIAP